MINLQLDGAVRTLMLTLRARADEQHHADPLLADSWSAAWYDLMPQIDALDDWYNPGFQLASVIRSRIIDDAVSEFIAAHDHPLIIELGAGFSTRYYRLGQGQTTWIELDLDEAIAARRKLDKAEQDHWFIAADMTATEWLDLLPTSDPKSTLFIAEGTLMFIDPAAVESLFKALKANYKGATILFDVLNPDYMQKVNAQFEKLNASMQWGIYEKDLKKLKLKVLETRYLLLEYPERWNAIDVPDDKRNKQNSGYVVIATFK